jgi:hypothetical protein
VVGGGGRAGQTVWHFQGGSDGAVAHNTQAPVLPMDAFLVLKDSTPLIQYCADSCCGSCVDSQMDC